MMKDAIIAAAIILGGCALISYVDYVCNECVLGREW